MEALIAYFSRTGNTEVVAEKVREVVGCELFRIRTTKEYSTDYNEVIGEAKRELRQNARPELTANADHLGNYDAVFLGYPNWWGTAPMAIFAFLERHDLSGKTIIPFCTHEGSGMGRSEKDIQAACPDSGVAEGISIRGGHVRGAWAEIANWLNRLGIQKDG